MKIIIIGLGSMGRRRIRLLKNISNDFIIYGIDNNEKRRQQVECEFDIRTDSDLSRCLEAIKPDCAIVSTSPLSHAEIIEECLRYGCHVFTELNLVDDGYEKNIKLARDNNKVLFLSSTFLYREEIQYIEKAVKEEKSKINYSYHVGQYLPDWHTWESINDYFVSNRRTNGCRELFAIELPWLIDVFGDIKSFNVISDKNSNLPIDYNDNYMLLIEHTNGNKGLLCVDVVSRKAVRNLEIYNEQLYMTWDGSPLGLKKYNIQDKKDENVCLYNKIDMQEGYAKFVVENAYRNELEAFFDAISGKKKIKYTFEDDLQVLHIINKIERM